MCKTANLLQIDEVLQQTKQFWPSFCFWHFGEEKQKIGKAMGQIRIQHAKIVLKPSHGKFYSKMP